MKTVKLRFLRKEDGQTYVEVSLDGVTDEVGPIEYGVEMTAVLDPPTYPLTLPAKTLRRRSQKAEVALAKDNGGRVQKGSGALTGLKGDVRVRGKFRIEHKFTQHKSYTLTKSDLDKILGECEGREDPVFVVEFVEPKTLRTTEKFYVIRDSLWSRLHQDDQ